jgi:hypothetical protein
VSGGRARAWRSSATRAVPPTSCPHRRPPASGAGRKASPAPRLLLRVGSRSGGGAGPRPRRARGAPGRCPLGEAGRRLPPGLCSCVPRTRGGADVRPPGRRRADRREPCRGWTRRRTRDDAARRGPGPAGDRLGGARHDAGRRRSLATRRRNGTGWSPNGANASRILLPKAMRLGIPSLTGSDVVGSIPREIALLVECGLEPVDALRAATTTAVGFLGADGAGAPPAVAPTRRIRARTSPR